MLNKKYLKPLFGLLLSLIVFLITIYFDAEPSLDLFLYIIGSVSLVLSVVYLIIDKKKNPTKNSLLYLFINKINKKSKKDVKKNKNSSSDISKK